MASVLCMKPTMQPQAAQVYDCGKMTVALQVHLGSRRSVFVSRLQCPCSKASVSSVRSRQTRYCAMRPICAAKADFDPFRTPLMAWFYENGYRQLLFRALGFPGRNAEVALAERAFGPSGSRRVLLDLSCGTGLHTRHFAQSRLYSRVIAADPSEAMLAEVRRRMPPELLSGASARADGLPVLDICRAELPSLPWGNDSIDLVHAGAALHCWPHPLGPCLEEVFRVLRPGGVLAASTVVASEPARVALAFQGLTRDGVKPMNVPFWDERVVTDALRQSGFVDVHILDREKSYVFVAARKPEMVREE